MKARIVIIGATLPGYAASLLLSQRGHLVSLVDEDAQLEGEVWLRSAPALTHMASEPIAPFMALTDLFAQVRLAPDEYFEAERVSELLRVFFPGGGVLAMPAHGIDLRRAIADFAGADAAREYDGLRHALRRTVHQFSQDAERVADASWASALSDGLRDLRESWSRPSLRQMLITHFTDPLLRAAFEQYAWAYGSDPRHASSTLLAQHEWDLTDMRRVKGGMPALLRGLERAAVRAGVTISRGVEHLDLIPHDRPGELLVRSNRGEYAAHAVLVTRASGSFRAGMREVGASSRTGLSTMSMTISGTVTGRALGADNVFLSTDLESELDDLFVERVLPDLPSVWLRTLPGGGDGLSLEVRVPEVGSEPEALAEFEARVMERLAEAGILLRIGASCTETPSTRRAPRFGAPYHSPLGRRPGPRTRERSIYRADASCAPGPTPSGLIRAAQQAADAMMRDLKERGFS